MKTFATVLGVGALAVTVTACNSSSSPIAPSVTAGASGAAVAGDLTPASGAGRSVERKPGPLTIVGIVLQDDGEFDVLQAAVIRAGLVDVLNGTTQFTVFAPTDAAFVATLGVGDEAAAITAVNALPLNALTDILTYHVTTGRRNSASVLGAPRYQMLNGKTLTREELVAAGIQTTDVAASNGIVHVIGRVLIPAS